MSWVCSISLSGEPSVHARPFRTFINKLVEREKICLLKVFGVSEMGKELQNEPGGLIYRKMLIELLKFF